MLKIKASFPLPDENDPSYENFTLSIQQHLENIIPEEAKKDLSKLNELLPLVICSSPNKHSLGIGITTLSASPYAHGTGRFMSDILSRWLIPGKILELGGTRTFAFFFEGHHTEFLINERWVIASTAEDYALVHHNAKDLAKEIRLTLSAVYHARHLLTVKTLTKQERDALIAENISSLIDRSSKAFDVSIFDELHQFFLKLSSEEKITQIRAHITPVFNMRVRVFDRDIFAEIQHFVLLFREKFTANHHLRYISRLICYQYLFRKALQVAITHNPSERHVSLKVFHVKRDPPILGILVGITFLRENEIFKKKHLKEAIYSCLPHVSEVTDSFVVDWRNDKVPTFYIEMEKSDQKLFTLQEVKRLRQNLPQELRERIENVSHPVFMLRNEEEVLRHIVILSNELKYVSDIPQVVITFNNQSHLELTFNVILLRLLKPDSQPLKNLLPSNVTMEEVKVVGYLRNRHPKEMNVFKITLAKAPFFRKDYSLDLHKARQAVVAQLTEVLGDIRDYNGGMIAKQTETLSELRRLLHEDKMQNDFLMENFFYAIEPPIMQSLLKPELLKIAFQMLWEGLEKESKQTPYFFKTLYTQCTYVAAIAAPSASLKEDLLAHLSFLNISSINLTFSSIVIHERSCFVIFYHITDETRSTQLTEAIRNFLSSTFFETQRVTASTEPIFR
jgi:hypothetical protein